MRENHKKTYTLLYTITFFVHMSVAYWIPTLTVLGDEMGVAAVAAYLVGEDWSSLVQSIPYYGFGQAILYVPIFFITKIPEIRYLLMGVVNSALLAAIPLFVYQILGQIDFLVPQKRFWYALIVSIFPPYLVYTKWIWNETLLCVLPWLLLWLILRRVADEGNIIVESAAIAVISVYCYAVHGRGILYIGVVFLMIIYLYVRYKIRVVNLPAFIVSTIGSYWIYSIVKNFLLSNLWKHTSEGTIGNTLEATLPNLLKIFSAEGFTQFFTMAAGHVMSAVISSYGFLVLVAFFAIHPKLKEFRSYLNYPQKDRMTIHVIGSFAILCFAGALFIDLVFLLGGVGDYLIYTRYYAGTIGFIVFWALIIMQDKVFLKKYWKDILLSFVCCIPLYFFIWSDVEFSSPTVFLNIYPYLFSKEPVALLKASFIIFLIFMLFLVIAKSKYSRLGIILLICLFLEAYYFCGINYIIPASTAKEATIQNMAGAPSQILEEIDELPQEYLTINFYDVSWGFDTYNLQFFLPEYQVRNIPKEAVIMQSVAEDSFLVAQDDIYIDYMYPTIYRIDDQRLEHSGNYMWAYGSELNRYIEEHDLCQTSNHYGEPWTIDLNRFSTVVGTRKGNCIVSSGKEGALLFGPYMSLACGSYTITITGRITSNMPNSCNFDIVYDGGSKWLASVSDLQQATKGEDLELQVNFTTKTDLTDCEFRIFVGDEVNLEIERVDLQKIIDLDNIVGG